MTASKPPRVFADVQLYDESYKVVVSKSHPLSERDAISLSTLAETDMLDRPNCEMRDALHGACADQGHELYVAYRSNRVDWLVELARQGLGAVILPTTAIPADSGLVSILIDGLEISRTVSALRYRHQTTRPETNDLIRDDVPPPIRTILSWNFPVMIPDREMESSDEGIEVY